MKKINKSNIILAIILIIVLIIQIKAFTGARANKIIEIAANIVDNSSLLSDEVYTIQAISDGDNGYCITLPNIVNDKIIKEYIIEKKKINEEENVVEEETIEETEIEENSKEPGEKVYLTNAEIESKEISLKVEYDRIQADEENLYNKQITQKIENNEIIIKGYMPEDGTVNAKIVDTNTIDEFTKAYTNKNTVVKIAYDIKIISQNVEYEPTEFDENVEVTISGLENIDTEIQKYKIIHIDDEQKEVEEIEEVETKDNSVVFKVKSFSTYAIMVENLEETGVEALAEGDTDYAVGSELSTTADVWDGSVATKFAYGEGTENNPYLISTGAELAYLAEQVNEGNEYEGTFFQLTTDINLNNKQWTPIGNAENSFKGIFDGAGRVIANTTIIITGSMSTSDIFSYGFFGSIGNGSSNTTIKNVQFENINISFQASGNTNTNTSTRKGYNIGIVTGSMYNNSKVSNVTVKNSNITATAQARIRSRIYQMFVGGIAGNAQNYSDNYNDPGDGKRYSIENCFVSANIDLSNIVSYQSGREYYMTLVHSGGIIGSISRQPVWPENCLYMGSITSNGFVGPIFGGVVQNNSTSNNTNNFSAYWNGNQVGGNLTMTSYYANFEVNGQSFTDTVTSGTSTAYVGSGISNSDISGVKGVNKGIYTEDVSSLLSTFNNGTTDVIWESEENNLSLIPRLRSSVIKGEENTYNAQIVDRYNIGDYTYQWQNNGVIDENYTSNSFQCEQSFSEDKNILLIVSDGTYFATSRFVVDKLYIAIEFNIDKANKSVTATLTGTALEYTDISEYTFQWNKMDMSGTDVEIIEGATSQKLTGLEEYMDYKLIVTHSEINGLSTENSFTFGDRTVVYVDENNGNNSNDGLSENTAVETLTQAYTKLSGSGNLQSNVIVIMGDYMNNDYISENNTTMQNRFSKPVMITGKYMGKDYNSRLYFYGSPDSGGLGRYLFADTGFQYLTLLGYNSNSNNGVTYFYAQGRSLTIGEQVYLDRYRSTSNTNALMDDSQAPDFHILGGFANHNSTSLPENNGTITIKSGAFARIIAGTRNTQVNNTSHNFTGSKADPFNTKIIIDIKKSTRDESRFKYDVNLLVGGQTDGTIYANTNLQIKNGRIGRVLGGSIGYSRTISGYPSNSFFGSTKLTISGGEIDEAYGGSLGRLQSDVYYYGNIEITISGGKINNTLYGVGAGGVTGYSENSTDVYKEYGKEYETKVTINITGGEINGNIYGAGYGYSSYLSNTQIASDGGTLYGDSYINISGGTIVGDVYGAGRGYSGYSGKIDLAQMHGDSFVTIKGTPTISGKVYGAGEGASSYENMAKLTGNANISIQGDLGTEVYGAGNIAKLIGSTNINIEKGNHTSDIYGGGNLGSVEGTANVNINGGTSTAIYAGGNSANVTNTNTYLKGGEVNYIYGGSNQTGEVQESYIETISGTAQTIYGGNNVGGRTQESNININGATITSDVYGGGNQVHTEKTKIILQSSENTIPNIYGGGNQAGVTTANININGGNASNIFGGSNISGIVSASNIDIYGGTIENIYGGGNQAGVTTTNINANGGNINNIFGGSNKSGDVTESYVTTNTNESIGQDGLIMDVKAQVYPTESWQSTTYPTYAIVSVTLSNTSEEQITEWAGEIYAKNSELMNNYSDTEITCEEGKYTFNHKNRYYGDNIILPGESYSFQFEILSMEDPNTFVLDYRIIKDDNNQIEPDLSIKTIYGGNNQGGTTNTTNVIINKDGVENVYGGGNQAYSDIANLKINAAVQNNVYGGGNQASVNNTNVNLIDAKVYGNVYGGGDEGTVLENTNVHIKNSTINNNVYAGGNGSSATVYGNTNLTIEGNSSAVTNSVFGGGNKAATGQESKKTSKSTVNIVGGTIGKNVYGGANTSVVYGTTQTNIGYNTLKDNSLEIGNIEIGGTIFGGGEANEAGDENYDFSFISVTNGIDIQINGNGHEEFNIKGSIFGSGNASSTSGDSFITIQDYGTADDPKDNVSIQRANYANIINSAISLSGATDRTNEYSNVYFSISRVDNVILKNNSTLYLCNGVNLLKNLQSAVNIEGVDEKAVVTINKDTGEISKNVDNRIYMLEGRNLNIATNEQVTAYGKVSGMIFFGLFTNKMNPSTSTGFYHNGYQNGDAITNAGTFSSNSYAMAEHMVNHNTEVDGFYTNYNENGKIKTNYIETTPKDDVYYIWLVGEKMDVTTFEIALTASKYATLGTYELLLQGFSNPNIKFSIAGFSAGLANDIELVDPKEIDPIAKDSNIANNVYGLSIRTGNTGWQTKGSTTFLTENGGTYTGDNQYNADNSNYTPTFNFCLYHSENITIEQNLGDVKIRFQVLTPIDDLNYKLSYIDINIALSSALYQDDFYEAAITPGQEFGLFTTTDTTITNKSGFSTYYSLYIENFSESEYYSNYKSYKRVLVSRDSDNNPYVLPKDTKITMLDMVTNQYYYYIVTQQDVENGKNVYEFSDFIAMGSNDKKFDEVLACDNYNDQEQNLIYENFIFHINFGDAILENEIRDNSLLIELRDDEQQTLVGVLGIQRDALVYTVYNDKDATIELEAAATPSIVYLGDSFDLNVITNFTQSIIDSKTIYDTQYFDKKLGIKISFYDSNGNRLNSDSLLGINFQLDGKLYYPRIDGTTRINIAGKVTDVLSRIKVNTENNKTLATGNYKIKIESFGSSDGIYYGLTSSDTIELDVTIINSAYGLKINTGDTSKIIDKETGNTTSGNNSLVTIIEYSSSLSNPNIAVSLYRRDYSETFSQDYTLVDLKDYVSDILTPTKRKNEYLITNNPSSSITQFFLMKSNITTGTYKMVYKLYDGDVYVGEAYEYMIIK